MVVNTRDSAYDLSVSLAHVGLAALADKPCCYMWKTSTNELIRPDCILCSRWQSPSPSHPSAADEARVLLKTRHAQWVTLHTI